MNKLLLCIFLFSCSLAGFSQQNDLGITYYANQGTSGLSGANKVYMYSGAATTAPTGAWEWIIGSPNLDDGIGEMTNLGNDTWYICIDPHDYYSQGIGGPIPAGTPVLTISMIFRNEDGTALGYDFNGLPIMLDLTTNPVTSTFTGVIPGNCSVGLNEFSPTAVRCHPNPFKDFTYFYLSGSTGATLTIYDVTGKVVKDLNVAGGQKVIKWDGTNDKGINVVNGVYFFRVLSDNKHFTTGKVMKLN